MSVKTLADFELGMYTEAMSATGPNGRKLYTGLSDYLEAQAVAGNVDESLVVAGEEAQVARYGKPLSGVRQVLHNSGLTLFGKHSSPMAAFFPARGKASGNTEHVKGAETLFPALAFEMFEAGIEGRVSASQGGFVSRPGTAQDLLYRQVTLNRIDDETRTQLENPNLLRLEDLVSINTGIDSDSARSMVVENPDLPYYEFGRVAEYGEIPTYTLSLAEREVRAYKRGGGIRASYEVLRRQSVNQFARVLLLFGLARRLQLTKDAVAVALNGDGNPNSGANDTLGVANPTVQNWDDYTIDSAFEDNLTFTHAAGDNVEVKGIRALRYPTQTAPMNPTMVEMYGQFVTPGGQILRLAPKGSALAGTRKTLFWNAAEGLEQFTENGSQIQEAERFILTQEEVMTLTYNTGFSKPLRDAFSTYTRP